MADETKPDELAAFVTTTLLAIAQGIHAAQGTQIVSAHITGVFGFTAPNEIEFDVAVSAKETGTAGGGIKVAVLGVGAKVGSGTAAENSTVSRIRFVVPTNFKQTVPGPSKKKSIRSVSST